MLDSLKLTIERHPLRSSAFLRLWLGLSISYVGDQFTTIALLWFVLQLTGSGVAISLILLCFQLPGMVTGPLLGAVLDRWQPRLVMGFDNCARALLIGAIPALAWSGMLQLWQIALLAFLAGTLSPATGVGMRVLLPHLVQEDALERANALTSTSSQFAFLVGPVLAGILVTHIGGAYALLVDAVSFLLMGLLVFSLPSISRAEHHAAPATKTNWLGGFALLTRFKELRLLTSLSVVFFFSYGPLEAALPLYSDRILHAGAQGYGLLWTGFGVGALVGALCTGLVAARARPGITQPLIAILWGGFLCPLMLFHSLSLALLCLALGACSWAPYLPIEASLLQRLVEPSMRGQVFGIRLALTTAAAPLGTLVGGLLLQYLAPNVVIGLSGLACVLAGLGGLVSPTMRGLDGKTKSVTRCAQERSVQRSREEETASRR
ncbi:MFS transporter [Ktedonobacter robiniae]|uniref:MFS transporter n=1 Tax=Ktedonobacter robiniae TaxID=2778365 RepID=A0ABQ3V7H9_9CHLR|nr:MFS transporter [Ktedonobacter robiniae]GHO60964.1 MFS transporter [Ktedonobacter robiniae]